MPFPSYQADADVDMSDASDVSVEPIISEQHHVRLDSGASTTSSSDFGDGMFSCILPIAFKLI